MLAEQVSAWAPNHRPRKREHLTIKPESAIGLFAWELTGHYTSWVAGSRDQQPWRKRYIEGDALYDPQLQFAANDNHPGDDNHPRGPKRMPRAGTAFAQPRTGEPKTRDASSLPAIVILIAPMLAELIAAGHPSDSANPLELVIRAFARRRLRRSYSSAASVGSR
jgi:hypothetical protein